MSEDAPPQHPRLRLSLHKGFKSPTAHSPSLTPFPTPRSGKAPSQDAAEAAQVQASWSCPVYLRPRAGLCLPVSPRPLGDAGSIHRDRPSCQGGTQGSSSLYLHPSIPSSPHGLNGSSFSRFKSCESTKWQQAPAKLLPAKKKKRKKRNLKAWNKHGGGEWL